MMSDSWTKLLGTGALCLVAGFTGGVWWGGVGRDEPARVPAGPTATHTAAAASQVETVATALPAVASSPESAPAPVPRTNTPVELGRVADNPQVALQMAVAESSGNGGDSVPTPLNRTDSSDRRVIDQRGIQPSQTALPESSGSAPSAAPSQVSQLEAQTQAGQ